MVQLSQAPKPDVPDEESGSGHWGIREPHPCRHRGTSVRTGSVRRNQSTARCCRSLDPQIRNSDLGKHSLSIFILPPSIKELHRRLVSRGQDSDEVISKRMQKSWDEISHWGAYDYVLVNDDLDATEEQLKTIISAERMRREQQPSLQSHVHTLQTEFEEMS